MCEIIVLCYNFLRKVTRFVIGEKREAVLK